MKHVFAGDFATDKSSFVWCLLLEMALQREVRACSNPFQRGKRIG